MRAPAQRLPGTGFKALPAHLWHGLSHRLRILLLALPLTLWICSVQAEEEAPFSPAELDQMLAPIALYPDTVLSHILIAATYPLEIVQATRWSQENPGLKGADAVAAVEDKDWDPSVQALVAFPDILKRMHDDLEWTRRLGDAVLIQEKEVLDSIQGLRQLAQSEGSLDAMEHVDVVREAQTIVIEPVEREVIYVPYYDSRIVYGNWRWPVYPPVYWYRPGHYYGVTGFYWGPGIHISPWFYFSSFHWHQRHVVVVHHHQRHYGPRYYSGRDISRHHNAKRWQHNPRHRRGVAYRDWPQRNVKHDSNHRRAATSRLRRDSIASGWSDNLRSSDRRTGAMAGTGQRSGELRQRLSEPRHFTAPRSEPRDPGVQRDRRHSGEPGQQLSSPQSAMGQSRQRANNPGLTENRATHTRRDARRTDAPVPQVRKENPKEKSNAKDSSRATPPGHNQSAKNRLVPREYKTRAR